MTEQGEIQKIVPEKKEIDALIAGKSLAFYWRASKLFLLLLVILEIVNILFEVHPYGSWIIEIVVFILMTIWLLKRWRIKLTTTLTACVFLGIMTGLVLAFFEIIWYHQWWYALDIIRKPFIIGAVGLVTGFVFYLLFQSIKTRKRRKGVTT